MCYMKLLDVVLGTKKAKHRTHVYQYMKSIYEIYIWHLCIVLSSRSTAACIIRYYYCYNHAFIYFSLSFSGSQPPAGIIRYYYCNHHALISSYLFLFPAHNRWYYSLLFMKHHAFISSSLFSFSGPQPLE